MSLREVLNKMAFIRVLGPPCGSVIKNTPAHVIDAGSIPGLGDHLEEKMATHTSRLTWKIPWTQESDRL